MGADNTEIEAVQRMMCAQLQVAFVAAPPEWISGFASETRGRLPLNGLRHQVSYETTGWYLWCGEDASQADDFYKPIHTEHLYREFPSAAKLLGLPAGHRFVFAGDYLDVWFDPSLLDT